jgi:hypothetical protein
MYRITGKDGQDGRLGLGGKKQGSSENKSVVVILPIQAAILSIL